VRLFGDTKWYGKNSMERNGLTVACVGPTDKRRLGAKFWTIRPVLRKERRTLVMVGAGVWNYYLTLGVM
jgi:hypothetical protein